MRKVLLSLLVLALAAPAMADVAVTAADLGGGVLEVTVTPSAGASVRGVALVLEATAGDAAVVAETDVETVGLNTFIDYAFSVGTGFNVGDGHPFAMWNAAGVATFPTSKYSLCAGFLDEAGNQAGQMGVMTFKVTYGLTADSTIAISSDTLRGGIVGDTLGNITIQPTQVLVGVVPPCMGDVNGDAVIDFFNDALTVFLALDANGNEDISPVPAELVNADMNGDGILDFFNDALTIFLMLDANGNEDIACP